MDREVLSQERPWLWRAREIDLSAIVGLRGIPVIIVGSTRRARSSGDRAADFYSAGRGFESLRARQLNPVKTIT